MKENLLISVSLRRLYVFTEICKNMHVGQAAEKLGITQPSLSEQIKMLETALGVTLFLRRNRSIELTEAGRTLLNEARMLLSAHQNAIEQVERVARGKMGKLSLGFVGSALAEEQLVWQLKAIQSRSPQIEFSLQEINCQAAVDALVNNALDLVILRGPGPLPPNLRYKVHSRQPIVLVMHPNHPLARQDVISIKELASYSVAGYTSADDNFGITPVMRTLAKAAGVELKIQWKVTTVAGVINMVASGSDIGFVPFHSALRASSSVIIRPLLEPTQSELWLVWHEHRVTQVLDHFLALMVETTI